MTLPKMKASIMLIKASHRSGSRNLAKHLLNKTENEHVTVHELRGFMAQGDDLTNALNEIHVLAQANKKIKKHLVSMSFNPPIGAVVTMNDFEDAINRAEETLGLVGQQRAVVVHEKNARKHVHVAWSRIDDNLKAIKLPFYKTKLKALSTLLFIEHGWALPKGYQNKNERDLTSVDLDEWQIGKRQETDPKQFKAQVQTLWQQSKDIVSFKEALAKNNLVLAKGDKKNIAVLVDIHGDVRSLNRTLSIKGKATKEVQKKIGDIDNLPTVNDAKQSFSQHHKDEYQYRHKTLIQRHKAQLQPHQQNVYALTNTHKAERQSLARSHEKQQQSEREKRQAQYATGLKGLFRWVTLQTYNLKQKHEAEYQVNLERDKQEKEALLQRQLRQREVAQLPIDNFKTQHRAELQIFNQEFVETMKSLGIEGNLTTKFNVQIDEDTLSLISSQQKRRQQYQHPQQEL